MIVTSTILWIAFSLSFIIAFSHTWREEFSTNDISGEYKFYSWMTTIVFGFIAILMSTEIQNLNETLLTIIETSLWFFTGIAFLICCIDITWPRMRYLSSEYRIYSCIVFFVLFLCSVFANNGL